MEDPTRPPSAIAEIRSQAMHRAVLAVISALAYLRAAGDPRLTGYALALLRRVQSTIADPGGSPRDDTASRWRTRDAIQGRGLARAVAILDAWEQSPTSTLADLGDIIREAYIFGVNAGIDSVLPEFAEQALADFDTH